MISLSPEAEAAAVELKARISHQHVELPLLPEVARKVVSIVNDPESDAHQLARVIQGDQTMAATILRIANSPAYSPQGNIASLQQAISRLGMQVLFEVAIAASVNSKMFHAPGFEDRIQDIWEDSLDTALWAREVARVSRRHVDAAFLCGLLHNIGRPMLLQWLVEDFPNLSRDDILGIEEMLLMSANKAVVQAWKLPDAVLDGVCGYSGKIEYLSEVGQLVRAGMLFTAWQKKPDSDPGETPEHGKVLAALHLYSDEVNRLKEMMLDIQSSKEVMRS